MVTVSKIARMKPITISKTASILDAAKTMTSNSVGLLVIVDDNDPSVPIGVVSERDVIRAVASSTRLTESVMAIATRNVVTIHGYDDVSKAGPLMAVHRIRHLVVVDEDGKLAGVLSIRDLIAERNLLTGMVKSYFS